MTNDQYPMTKVSPEMLVFDVACCRVTTVQKTTRRIAVRVLGIGYWVLGIGYWVLGIGY